MTDDIVTLITEIDEETEEKFDTFANVESVGQKEFFAAAQAGFKADFKITVWASDYDGQVIVELYSQRYSVYRTYLLNDGHIELYLTSKVGVCGLSSISWTQKCENQPDKIKLSYSIGDKKLMAE